jgi:hypothetical protein
MTGLRPDWVCRQFCERHTQWLQVVTPCRLDVDIKEVFGEAQATGEIENHCQI